MEVKSPADLRLTEHLLALLRGIKLSRDLDLAEAALRKERELLNELEKDGWTETGERVRRRIVKRETVNA